MKMPDIAIIMTAMGVLVILTNALTELFKSIFPKLPASLTATIIGLILTVCAICAYISINKIPLEWYIIIGAIISGLFVAYTAMFGYDKFNEIIKLLNGGKATNKESEEKDGTKGD